MWQVVLLLAGGTFELVISQVYKRWWVRAFYLVTGVWGIAAGLILLNVLSPTALWR